MSGIKQTVCRYFNSPTGCTSNNCTFSHQPQPQLQQHFQNLNTNSNSYQPNNPQQHVNYQPNFNSSNYPQNRNNNSNYQSNFNHQQNLNGQQAHFRPQNQNQNQNQNQGPSNRHSNSNFNNNGNNNQRNQNKKSKIKDYKTQGTELEQKLLCLMGLISSGKILNKISIRIITSCSFTYSKPEFIPHIETKNAKCNIFYKENEKSKPTTFYIDYTENSKKIDRLLEAIQTKPNDYILQEENEEPFVLFHNGRISTSYGTFVDLYNNGLENGNLQLYKKDFTKKDEKYKVNCFIGGKTFGCKYVMGNYQITSRALYKSKNQEKVKDSFCVVCLDSEATHAMVPCGHLCVCSDCGDPTRLYNCPMCRGRIERIMKIF